MGPDQTWYDLTDFEARTMRRRGRGNASRLNRKLQSVKLRFERLEDRIAPGSLLDLVGMAAIGSMQPESKKQTAVDQVACQSHSAQRSQFALSLRMTALPIGHLASLAMTVEPTRASDFAAGNSDFAADKMDDGQWNDSTGRMAIDQGVMAEDTGRSASSPKGFGRALSDAALDKRRLADDFRDMRPQDADAAHADRQAFVLGSGNVQLPGNAFQPSHLQLGNWMPAAILPVSADFGMGGSDAGSAANVSASFGAAGIPGGADAASEAFGSVLNSPSKELLDASQIKAMGPNEHRLPPELRGRTDDLLAGQSLNPYAVNYPKPQSQPSTGVVRSPTEFDPMRGVLFSYASYPSVVTDMVKELTEDPTTDDIAYVVVNSESQRNTATNSFVASGADMSKVQFFIQPMNSVWIRDYGPHFITVDDALAIVDSHYYPSRSLDNFIPTLVGDNNFNVPTYDVGLYFSGGNFQPGPDRTGFVTALVNSDNPAADGFDTALISELHSQYLGIDTLHVLPQLPFSVDGTGHIDMWMYLVDHDSVIISEFLPGSNSTAIQITNNAVGYMESLGYKVYRTPAWNAGGVHFTYANAFRVNNRIFVPVYGTSYKPGGNSAYNSRDDLAIQAWQAAAGPGVEIIPIQCSQIIPASGAIHCIVKQVPRNTRDAPAVNIIAPAGGEILTPDSPFRIEWSAMDANNVDPVEILIYVSYGDGRYQQLATTSDTGSYLWNVSGKINRAESATIKIVARSASGSKTEVISSPFSISPGKVLTYDFSSGAGIDRFAHGSQTTSWASINGNPFPVSAQLTTTNYARLATSNAVGGNDADTNRYIAPVPSPISSESTHLFTFQLSTPVTQMAQLEVLWEGYGDFATQVELYVWDRVAQNWGDGAGLTGVNRYMDSWAGNIDGFLTGAIRSDFARYVDDAGIIRFLVYTDRPGAVGSPGSGVETFHDYMSVKVKEIEFSRPVRLA